MVAYHPPTGADGTGKITKEVAKLHATCVSYGRPRTVVEGRLKKISHQLARTRNELMQCSVQLPAWTDNASSPFSSTILMTIIEALVNNGLHRLSRAFDHRQTILHFHADDHRLIRAYYALEANEEQREMARVYWQQTAQQLQAIEEEAVYRKRVALKRLVPSFDQMIDDTIDPVRQLLSRPILSQDRRATLVSHCSKTITQYKFDLMALILATVRETAREHAQAALKAKNAVLDLAGDNQPKEVAEQLIKAMEAPAENMQQGAQARLKTKMSSFFDSASMDLDEDKDDSEFIGAKSLFSPK